MTEPDTTGPVRPLPDPHGPEKPPKANDVRRALDQITATTAAAAATTGRPPRADGADIIRDLRRQLVQEREAAEWRQKCIDEAIAAIHDAPQEIAPLLPRVAPADLPRAVRALIDRARAQLVEALVRALTAETELDAARADVAALRRGARGELAVAREAYQRLAEEVERHAGAQCACDTNGECLARLYQQAHALTATAPETAPESPQTADPAPEQAEAASEPLMAAEVKLPARLTTMRRRLEDAEQAIAEALRLAARLLASRTLTDSPSTPDTGSTT